MEKMIWEVSNPKNRKDFWVTMWKIDCSMYELGAKDGCGCEETCDSQRACKKGSL